MTKSLWPSRAILLIEDNPDDIEMTLRFFRGSNIANEVIAITDGAQALDYLFCQGKYASRPPRNPIMIILDLKLPKIDGIDVLRRIRSNELTKNIPVAILTTSNDEEDKIASYELGIKSYIRKPVAFDQFLITTKQLSFYWAIVENPPEVCAQ